MFIFFVKKLNIWGRVSSFLKHYPYSLYYKKENVYEKTLEIVLEIVFFK